LISINVWRIERKTQAPTQEISFYLARTSNSCFYPSKALFFHLDQRYARGLFPAHLGSFISNLVFPIQALEFVNDMKKGRKGVLQKQVLLSNTGFNQWICRTFFRICKRIHN